MASSGLCECGCGAEVAKRFIRGHSLRLRGKSNARRNAIYYASKPQAGGLVNASN